MTSLNVFANYFIKTIFARASVSIDGFETFQMFMHIVDQCFQFDSVFVEHCLIRFDDATIAYLKLRVIFVFD